ncbi:MAG: trigger factor [Deltaproteobacteria bacterium]|nr:trigger factor [Candidatus Zymogenaceae bacterium]
MKVTVEDVSSVKKKITVIIPRDVVDSAVEDAYVALGKKAKVKGFRPGKIPRHVLKSIFKDQVKSDVTEKLFGDTYSKALTEAGVHPVSYPEVDTEGAAEGQDFTYSAAVEVAPEITLCDYKAIEVERLKIDIDKKEIDAFLDRLAENHATIEAEQKERPIKKGDIVTVSFAGSIDGKPVKEAAAENYPVEIGAGRFIEDFEKHLIGAESGQHLSFEVEFPADYHVKDLAGKRIQFEVDIKEIRVKNLPKIDDEFAKDVGEFENLKALKEDVKKRLEEAAGKREDQAVSRRIIKKLVEQHPIETPQSLVEAQSLDIIRDTEMRLRSQGLSLEMMEAKPDEMMATIKPRAEYEVKARLILEEIAKREDITTTKEEAQQRLKDDAQSLKMKYEDMKKRYDKDDAWDDLASRMTEEKTLDFLTKLVKIKEVKKLSKEFRETTESEEAE